MSRTKLFAVALVSLWLGACGGGSEDGPETPSGGVTTVAAGDGSLLIANLNAITERDLESGTETVLLSLPEPNAFVLDPAASPDGSRVAYVRQPPPKVEDGKFDAGSDLWVMNRDGSSPRAVFEHVQPNQLVRFPRWEDESNILAIVQEIGTEDGITRVIYTLERINADSGDREKLLEDILAFDVSPDGSRLTYAKLLPQTGEVLQASALDSSDSVEVVGKEQLLAPFSFPRFSPDGESIAFASADQTGARAPVQLVSITNDGSMSSSTGGVVASALLDGLPQDVWTVEAMGGQAVRVADLKEDLPSITWDGSGERIYAIGVDGMYEINITAGIVTVIGEGAFHAQVSWAP